MKREEKNLVDYQVMLAAVTGVILLKRLFYYYPGYATFNDMIMMVDYTTVNLLRIFFTFSIPLIFSIVFAALFTDDIKREMQVSGFIASFISVLPILIFEELRPWELVEAHKIHLLYLLYAFYILVYVNFMGFGASLGFRIGQSIREKKHPLAQQILAEIKKSWRAEIAALVSTGLFYFINQLIAKIMEEAAW